MTKELIDTSFSTDLEKLIYALSDKRKIWILTGAGISAPSGIPTYRDDKGEWKSANPIQHKEFIEHKSYRQRYWARSMVGWKLTGKAKPNATHHAITALQRTNKISQIVTQNVDGLHNAAGTENIIDLHGRLSEIKCLDCDEISKRKDYQPRLVENNPELDDYKAAIMPDGDANVEDFDMSKINIPPCKNCGGVLMPNVIFFGGMVPKKRVQKAFSTLAESDCILVIGSSLKVFSGYRFPLWASQNNLPLYAVNQGEMRGMDLFDIVVRDPCEEAIPQIATKLV
ncbi:UNVERIFIED_CONTAM: hypothetical protein GTU68_036125 [Idotea baltica]|nr:hypothetical protein [Idotea baltica]